MNFSTADLCDEFGDNLQVAAKEFRSFGGISACFGKIETIKIDEDNSGLIALLKESGEGRIAVVDVDGIYCAVVGDKLMGIASKNGWAGIVINGYVRDTKITKTIPVGLWALGTCPRKSKKKADAINNIELDFGGIKFNPGNYLYIDDDGVICSDIILVK